MPDSGHSSLDRFSSRLYLVDVSSFIFRAYHAIRPLSSRKGEPLNAVYGVAQMLAKLVQDEKASHIAIVYDSKEPSFRKVKYSEYKANRSAPPDDLIPQFDRIEQLIHAMGLPSFRQSGVEADDIIGTLAVNWIKHSADRSVVIVSGDKDLMQLVNDRVRILDTLSNKTYEPPQVEEKFGVKPSQIRDYLALVGDSSDNIPGVPSIGPKTAAELLKAYGDLESVLQAARDGKISGKKGELLVSHAGDAQLSAELASLLLDLNFDPDATEVEYRFQVTPECEELLRELDFTTVLTKWQTYVAAQAATSPNSPHACNAQSTSQAALQNTGQNTVGPVTTPSVDFRTINTEDKFEELIQGIERTKSFGFDLETTSLNPRDAQIVGIAICYDPAFGCYIPVGHIGTNEAQLPIQWVMSRLKPYLEDPRYKKIGQNLKYDWSILEEHGINPDGIGADTMIAAYVFEPEGRHNLETLARIHLDYQVKTYEQVCGKGKSQITFDQVPIDQATKYSAEDAWVAVHLWNVLKPKLEAAKLMEVLAEIDLPLVDILCRMERQGVCINEKYLTELSQEFEKDLQKIEKRIATFTSGPVNLNSPKQLAQLLFEELGLPTATKTKTGYSTDAAVLEGLADQHEVPRLLLEYREISKLKGTYVDPLPLLKDRKTGKIHASFHQTVAATGRLSSSDPNLQNIPVRTERGRKIRRAFIASPGNLLLSADYSQIELRILAHMSGDADLCDSFQKDEDVHRRTAGEIFGISPLAVSELQRGIAKAINFGLMYGKTAFALAQELSISRKEAQQTIDRYFERYRGVKEFLDGQIALAHERGWTATMLGRKRNLADINARNSMLRQSAERMAMNTPIQGTAADLMKLAMIHVDEALRAQKVQSKLIIQVHDEILLDCPKSEIDVVQPLIIDRLEHAMKLKVPLRVNVATAENWEALL